MEPTNVKVLLVRKSQIGSSLLAKRLSARGCECSFASTSQNVCALLDQQVYDLVLGPIRLEAQSLYSLLDRLEGTETTLFYSLGVEDGCWWLPALRRGKNCFGAPAIHNGAFLEALEKTIAEIRGRGRPSAESLRHSRPLITDVLSDSNALDSVPSDSIRADLIELFPASQTLSSVRSPAEDLPEPAPPASSKIITIAARRGAR